MEELLFAGKRKLLGEALQIYGVHLDERQNVCLLLILQRAVLENAVECDLVIDWVADE